MIEEHPDLVPGPPDEPPEGDGSEGQEPGEVAPVATSPVALLAWLGGLWALSMVTCGGLLCLVLLPSALPPPAPGSAVPLGEPAKLKHHRLVTSVATFDAPIEDLVVDGDDLWVADGGLHHIDLRTGEREDVVAPDEIHRIGARVGWLFVGTRDGRLLRVGTDGATETVARYVEGISRVDVASDGTGVLVCADSGTVDLLHPDGSRRWAARTLQWPYGGAFSGDGRYAAVGTWDGLLHVLDVRHPPDRDEPLPANGFEVTGGPIFDAAFVDGYRVAVVGATAESEGFVRIWDPWDKRWFGRTSDRSPLYALATHGDMVAVGGARGAVHLMKGLDLVPVANFEADPVPLATSERGRFPSNFVYEVVDNAAAVRALAFGVDGNALFVGTQAGEVLEVKVEAASAPTAGPRSSRLPNSREAIVVRDLVRAHNERWVGAPPAAHRPDQIRGAPVPEGLRGLWEAADGLDLGSDGPRIRRVLETVPIPLEPRSARPELLVFAEDDREWYAVTTGLGPWGEPGKVVRGRPHTFDTMGRDAAVAGDLPDVLARWLGASLDTP